MLCLGKSDQIMNPKVDPVLYNFEHRRNSQVGARF
jgi:hypothetical protein